MEEIFVKTVSFKIDEPFLGEIEALASEIHETKSSMIKKALSFYIDNFDGIIAKSRNEDSDKKLIPHEDVLKEYGLL
jgi:predicted transcriptional regulator